MLDLFIDAPNDARITEGTRFWNASGIGFSAGPQGPSSMSRPRRCFRAASPSTRCARRQRFGRGTCSSSMGPDTGPPERVRRGYRLPPACDRLFRWIGSRAEHWRAVDFRGVTVGEVTGIEATVVDGERGRRSRCAPPCRDPAAPRHRGQQRRGAGSRTLNLLDPEINQGMRARLATSGLLGQSLRRARDARQSAARARCCAMPRPIRCCRARRRRYRASGPRRRGDAAAGEPAERRGSDALGPDPARQHQHPGDERQRQAAPRSRARDR